jgi:hypothetical protein
MRYCLSSDENTTIYMGFEGVEMETLPNYPNKRENALKAGGMKVEYNRN